MTRTPAEALDDATSDVRGAVDVLHDTLEPMPAELSAVFGSVAEHLRWLDHLAATLAKAYDRLPADLRCDNDADPFTTVREVLIGIDDIRMHLDRADQAVQAAHNHAARIAVR